MCPDNRGCCQHSSSIRNAGRAAAHTQTHHFVTDFVTVCTAACMACPQGTGRQAAGSVPDRHGLGPGAHCLSVTFIGQITVAGTIPPTHSRNDIAHIQQPTYSRRPHAAAGAPRRRTAPCALRSVLRILLVAPSAVTKHKNISSIVAKQTPLPRTQTVVTVSQHMNPLQPQPFCRLLSAHTHSVAKSMRRDIQ